MNHTPGPWRTNGEDDSVNDHAVTAGRDESGAFVYICFPYHDRDARLIASSPDLYRILVRAMTWEGRLNKAEQLWMQDDRAGCTRIKNEVRKEQAEARSVLEILEENKT